MTQHLVQLTCPGCGTTKQVDRHELYPEEGVRDWITVSWSYHTMYVCSLACLAKWSGDQASREQTMQARS